MVELQESVGMKKYLVGVLGLVIAGCIIWVQQQHIASLRDENEGLTQTKGALLDSVRHYRTKDGLNAAEMASIRLTIDELKKYRAEDLKLIESLKTKGRDVEQIVTVNTYTRDTIYTVLRDSIIRRDTIMEPVRAIDLDKRWYSIHGFIAADTLIGTLSTKSSLKIVETVKYKRFLGFLWKTHKVKNRKVDVVSLNPNETIENVDFVIIEE